MGYEYENRNNGILTVQRYHLDLILGILPAHVPCLGMMFLMTPSGWPLVWILRPEGVFLGKYGIPGGWYSAQAAKVLRSSASLW